jgi:hypothetical protein
MTTKHLTTTTAQILSFPSGTYVVLSLKKERRVLDINIVAEESPVLLTSRAQNPPFFLKNGQRRVRNGRFVGVVGARILVASGQIRLLRIIVSGVSDCSTLNVPSASL